MFPDNGHGPCSDCQREKFDPWNVIAIPAFYMMLGGCTVRDFILARWKSKS